MALRTNLLPNRRRSRRAALPDEGSLGRQLLIAWLHLAVLWSFAFAKPLFDVLADSPEFFVARGNPRGDILLFAFALILIPPTALVLVEALAARLPPLRRALHLLFVGSLVAAFALQLFDDALGGGTAFLLTLATAAGVAGAAVYARAHAARAVLTVLGPAPLVFLLLFLLLSPVSDLVLPQDVEEAARVDIAARTPVVLVVFDEFDSNMLMDARQRVDRTRYPTFAALADDATWYRNATTVSDSTPFAVPGLLSGRRPEPDSLPIAADYPNNAFTLLGGSHAMHAIETATELCPVRLCGQREREPFGTRLRSLASDLGLVSLHLLLPQSLRSDLPAVDRTFSDFRTGGGDDAPVTTGGNVEASIPASFHRNKTRPVEQLLRSIEPNPRRPGFHFLHAALPHIPWQYLPSGQQYLLNGPETPGLTDDTWSEDPWPATHGLQRHLLQVGYVDHVVGRLLARLKRAGLYDSAMVVLTADHGVSHRPGEHRRMIARATASDIAAVPLFIKYPRQRRGRIDDSMVRNIDIVPTIADRLGSQLPWAADGRPIRKGSPSPDRRVRVSVLGSNDFVSLSFAAFKREREAGLGRMIRMFGSGDGGRGLYATQRGADLLGRRVRELDAGTRVPARFDLDAAELFNDVRPAARLIPCLVSGRIVGDVGEGTTLAVAMNGRVRAVTSTFRDDESTRIAAIVPPESLRHGRNRVEVFVVEGAGDSRRLVRLQTERLQAYRLVERNGQAVIVGAGREMPVRSGQLEGLVEDLARDDERLIVFGWAADPDSGRVPDRILVFAGRRLVTQGRPTKRRPDVAAHFERPSLARAGFELRSSGVGVDVSQVRVFAVLGEKASELTARTE